MATITFDTLKFGNKLKAAGVADKHAEAEAEAIAEVIQVNFKELVTKEDLRRELKEFEMRFDTKLERLEGKLMGEITQVRGEITLLKWMLGVLLAGVVSLVLKAFFV
ncbi:MAG: DUF1640 domain-containing protein [Pseudomonadota bacterium]|nr:DUF1640 domain-containing protein [Pseudomonadota bacterium]